MQNINNTIKQTKIIATIGPASSDKIILSQLIEAGVDVFRLNFSHGNLDTHWQNIQNIRNLSKQLDKSVAIMGDLQGPKIRVAKFANNKVNLVLNQQFILDCAKQTPGDEQSVGVDYPELANDVVSGDILLLDDGKISFKVDKVIEQQVYCTVIQAGVLSNNKGINKQGGGLTAPALTEKDLIDLKFAADNCLDYLAVSFVRDKLDIEQARNLLAQYQSKAGIIAKIERVEAITNLEEIIEACDGVMVARGDLAVEVGEARVPYLQKKMLKLASKHYKISIVATQMLESMINSPVATRAEVSDIANAILDGTDAVMLSAESASGSFPLEAVKTMVRVCLATEQSKERSLEVDFIDQKFTHIDQTIAMSSIFSAYHLQAKLVLAITTSGATALWLSKVDSGIPVIAVTSSWQAWAKMALYRNVLPLIVESGDSDLLSLINITKELLITKGMINSGDRVLVTFGEHAHDIGGTNTMKIMQW